MPVFRYIHTVSVTIYIRKHPPCTVSTDTLFNLYLQRSGSTARFQRGSGTTAMVVQTKQYGSTARQWHFYSAINDFGAESVRVIRSKWIACWRAVFAALDWTCLILELFRGAAENYVKNFIEQPYRNSLNVGTFRHNLKSDWRCREVELEGGYRILNTKRFVIREAIQRSYGTTADNSWHRMRDLK